MGIYKNNIFAMKRFLLAIVAILMFMAAQAQPSLQQTIDALASAPPSRAGEITEIDLSGYGPQTKTLEVHGGVKVRFVNGTLTCTDALTDAIVNISEGSYLELASTAIIKTGSGNYATYSGIVTMNSGDFYVTGGQMLNYQSNYPWAIMVETKTGVNNIKVTSGNVYGRISSNNKQDYIELTGGSIDGVKARYKEANIIFGGAEISSFACLGSNTYNIVPKITAPLKTKIRFQPNVMETIAVRGNDYSITDSDIQKIEVLYNDKTDWEIYYDGDRVRFREKQGITNSSDLQAAIDALTAPGTIEIPQEGIVIDQPIFIGSHQVTLTGGALNVVEGFDQKTNADFVFNISESGSLTLKNITYNENNNFHHFSRFFVYKGSLTFDDGFKTSNLYQGKEHNFGFIYSSYSNIKIRDGKIQLSAGNIINAIETSEIDIRGGELITGNFDAVIYGKANVNQSGGYILSPDKVALMLNSENCFIINSGTISGGANGNVIEGCRTFYYGGKIIGNSTSCTGNISGNPDFSELKNLLFHGHSEVEGCVIMPICSLYKDSEILVLSELMNKWKIKSFYWDKIERNKPIILSSNYYKLTRADFEKMEFVDLPAGCSAKFNESEGYVYIGEQSLQDLLDNLAGDGEGTIKPGDEGLNIDEDTNVPGDLQLLIDGLAENGTNGDMYFDGGDLYIPSTSVVNITNINIIGCGKGNHIYVDGTLIIEGTVTVKQFIDIFIHIRRGGCVIWKGGTVGGNGDLDGVAIPIYNDGGTFEFRGGTVYGTDTGIKNISGTIAIYGGTINGGVGGGINNGSGGIVYINGGRVIGGIFNYGNMQINYGEVYGTGSVPAVSNYGEFTMNEGILDGGGSGVSITTITNITICGCVDMQDIYIHLGVKIFLTAKIETEVRIHLIIDGDIPGETVLVYGANGYNLTQADFDKLKFILPEGWIAKFDPATMSITVSKPSGINGVVNDSDKAVYDVYNLQGIKVGDSNCTNSLPSGLYIMKGKKVYINN